MKTIFIFALLVFLCPGCDKGGFDINNPDVTEFVRQLENGTYDQFEWTEDGERLWAKMPAFQKKDIPELISLAKETGLIIHSTTLTADFFDLKTGIAGEILQKFSNYRMRLAIIGDFTDVKSKALRDFIPESNSRGTINFVGTVEEALTRFDR